MSTVGAAEKQRLLDAGGPIEDDATARQKMRDAKVYDAESEERTGFDPDNVMDVKKMMPECTILYTPMTYFAEKGDIPVMRWLYINGADVTADSGDYTDSPIGCAVDYGSEEAVKWLFLRGGAGDLVGQPFNHLFRLFGREKHRNLVVWLILNGAFCRDDNDSGLLDVEKMKASLGRSSTVEAFANVTNRVAMANARRLLLEWAVERNNTRTSFLTFLNGTHSRPEGKISPFLVSLNGKPGILELIADYSGPPLRREALIVRQLVELLPRVYGMLVDSEDFWESSTDIVHIYS